MKKFTSTLFVLILAGAAWSEEAPFKYRELSTCGKDDETAWRPAQLKIRRSKNVTTVTVDALFNCGSSPSDPAVLHSPVSTTLSVEEAGMFGAMCLCKRVLEFQIPERLETGTTVYFSVEGKVFGHAAVR